MKTIKHSLDFVTELDENNPTAKRLLSLPENEREMLLKSMLITTLNLNDLVDAVNSGNSWAKLKIIK